MSSQKSYLDALRQVTDEVVAPGAASVDADGAFPRAQLDALAAAGSTNPAKLNAAIARTHARTTAGLITFSQFTHAAITAYHVTG